MGQISFFWLILFYNSYWSYPEYYREYYRYEQSEYSKDYNPFALTAWWFSIAFITGFLLLIFTFIFLKNIIQSINK
jgi:hypothetical protein